MNEKRDRKNKILRFAEANMRFEGFVITKEARRNAARILERKTTADTVVAACVAKYQKEDNERLFYGR